MEANTDRESLRSADLGDLVRRAFDDAKSIARDELALAKVELKRGAVVAAADAAIVLLGAIVALVGLGMLCAAAVVALDAWIDSLAVRLLIMAAVYMIAGGAVAAVFGKKLGKDAKPDLERTAYEARRTINTVKEELRHA